MFKKVVKEQLKVPAHVDYLSELRDFVIRIGRKHGVDEKTLNAFKLAIDEAGTNIIRHAYRGYDGQGTILLRVIIRKASITVSLIDQGKYFDPKGVKDPDLKRYVDIGKKGGLGIFIIRKIMDEIDYRHTPEGNELRLTKSRTTEKKRGVKQITDRARNVPLSLKSAYFVRTAAVVTAIVAIVYVYFFIREAHNVREESLANLASVGASIISELSNDTSMFELENMHYLYEAVREFYDSHSAEIYDILVVDPNGIIRGASDTTKWLEPFVKPRAGVKHVTNKILEYEITDRIGKGKVELKRVYDFKATLADTAIHVTFGDIHVRLLRSTLDAKIALRRWEAARVALSILLMSYAGALLLIYLLLNPFHKLADWVSAMDHGEIQDEMDIDSSTEIGEIARAFSDITSRFRESQKHLADQEQLQKEMHVAQEIQRTLLPSEFPEIEGYEIASYYEAAKEVGGDYFDFVEVDKDTLGIVVADVSGKGVPGSLVMTMIRTALRTEARGVKDAAEVLARVNDFVVGDMKKGMFVTIFYMIIDSARRRLNYASAGHNPMILYRPSTEKTYYLNPKGFPIGIQLSDEKLFRKSIESDTIQLAENDILLLYTDGITEAMNSRRELFGEERLLKVMREYGHMRVEPFVEKLQLEIQSFTEGYVQYDDITLVAIKEKSSQEKEQFRRARLAFDAMNSGETVKEACDQAGISVYAYNQKYKAIFDEKGVDGFDIPAEVSVEAKHTSIEEKTKIFDIIKNHPEYGPKRISEEMNTEKYGFTEIPENQIYDELVRSRLNTRQLREAFVSRGSRLKRHLKPPGTPLLTLDGRIIMEQKSIDPRPVQDEPSNPPARKEPEDDAFSLKVRRRPAGEAASVQDESLPETAEDSDFVDESHVDASGSDELILENDPLDEDVAGRSLDDLDDFPAMASDADALAMTDSFGFEALAEVNSNGTVDDMGTLADASDELDKKEHEATSDRYANQQANIGQAGFFSTDEPEETSQNEATSHGNSHDYIAIDDVDDLLISEIHSSFEDAASNVFTEDTIEQDSLLLIDDGGDGAATTTGSQEIDPQQKDDTEQFSETGEFTETEEELILSAEPEEDMESGEYEIESEKKYEQPEATVYDFDLSQTPDALLDLSEELDDSEEFSADTGDEPIEFVSTGSPHDISDEMGAETVAATPNDDSVETEEQAPAERSDAADFVQAELSDRNGQASPRSDYSSLEAYGDETVTGGIADQDETDTFLDLIASDTQTTRKQQFGANPVRGQSASQPVSRPARATGTAVVADARSATGVTGGQITKEDVLERGLKYYKRRDYSHAIREFRTAVALFPDFREAFSILGNAYFRNDEHENALEAYCKVLELNPNDTTAMENVGVIFANQGKLKEALELWQKILDLDPSRRDVRRKIARAMELLENEPLTQ